MIVSAFHFDQQIDPGTGQPLQSTLLVRDTPAGVRIRVSSLTLICKHGLLNGWDCSESAGHGGVATSTPHGSCSDLQAGGSVRKLKRKGAASDKTVYKWRKERKR